MKYSKIISRILVVVIIVTAGVLWFVQRSHKTAEVPQENLSTYIKEHISELSEEKEVLGGTFYVTDIEAGNGAGVVKYEDGHNAYKADFTYTFDRNGEPIIKSFVIRN